MRRLLIPLILILTIGSQLLPAIQYNTTKAQTPTTTLRQNFDDLDEIEYELVRGIVGSGEGGQGVRANGGSATSPINSAELNAPLHIILTIPEWCTLQSISWRETGDRILYQAFRQLFQQQRVNNSNGTAFWFVTSASYEYAWRNASIVIADPPWNGGTGGGAGGTVELFYGGYDVQDTLIFDSFEMVCEGQPALIRPFSIEDELNAENSPLLVPGSADTSVALGDYRWAQDRTSALYVGAFKSPYMVAARSYRPGAPVLAAGDGVIESVEPFSREWCAISSALTEDRCIFALPTAFNAANFLMFYVSELIPDAGRVRLRLDNGDLIEYFVNNPERYVHPGLVVQAGCILGESFQANTGIGEAASLISFLIDSIRQGLGQIVTADLGGENVGVAFMFRPSDEPILSPGSKLLDELTEYAAVDQACNVNPDLADCLTFNPQMTDGDGWTSFGQVTWLPNAGGALVAPGASIFQTLSLTDIAYTAKALVNPVFSGSGGHRFRLQLGTLNNEFTIDATGLGGVPYQLVGDPDPDYGGMGYTVGVTNTGPSNIIVKHICVEAGETAEPTSCTFTNPTFENDLSGWTPSDSSVIWRNGSAFIPIGQNITQGAPLPPGDYVLDFDVRIAFDPATYTGGGAVSVNVYRPDGASGNYPLDIGWNQVGGAGYPITAQRLSITFAQIAPAGNFVRFEPVLDTAATGILGIWLDRACLYLTTQGPSDGGGQCARPSSPINSDVGAWTSWHWANLNRFFTCELMITLNSQYDFIQTSTRTGLMSVRWFMASMNASSAWLGTDFVPWLNGHFRNMAVGQVTTINNESGTGVWDVLLAVVGIFRDNLQLFSDALLSILPTLLGLVYNVAQIVFTIILGAIGFVLALVTRVAGLMNMAGTLLGTIVTAYNTATPISIPLLPQCSAVDPRTQPACVVFWMLDNTLFSGLGEVYVPLILSILSIHLVLNVVIDIRKTVIELGKVS